MNTLKQDLAKERYPGLIKARNYYLEIAYNPEKTLSKGLEIQGLDPNFKSAPIMKNIWN